MVQIEWCWFHSKIFMFGQKMARMPIFGHTFFGHNSANWAKKFYGSSGDHHLSIGDEKSKLQYLFFIFWATFGGKMGVAITRAPNGLGPQNLTKKLAHWMDL